MKIEGVYAPSIFYMRRLTNKPTVTLIKNPTSTGMDVGFLFLILMC